MIDIKCISIRDLLPIASAQYAQGISPLSLYITGSSFDQASSILINDIEAPEYMVLSPSRLLVQVPTSEKDLPLRKLAVLAESPSMTRSSLLHFTVGSALRTLKGIERLVQFFVKLLLQTPGSDKFNKTLGGGLLGAVGKNISKTDTKNIQAAVVGSVNRTRDQILTIQAQNSRIPADERLLSVKTDAVGFDPNTASVSASLILAAVSGRQAVANLTF